MCVSRMKLFFRRACWVACDRGRSAKLANDNSDPVEVLSLFFPSVLVSSSVILSRFVLSRFVQVAARRSCQGDPGLQIVDFRLELGRLPLAAIIYGCCTTFSFPLPLRNFLRLLSPSALELPPSLDLLPPSLRRALLTKLCFHLGTLALRPEEDEDPPTVSVMFRSVLNERS